MKAKKEESVDKIQQNIAILNQHLKNYSNTVLVGHADTIQTILTGCKQAANFHHAQIITGNDGIGKETFLYHLITELSQIGFTNQSDAQKSKNMFLDGSHPDIYYIQDEDGEVSVDTIRAMLQFANLKPSFLSRKYIAINCLDSLNNNAANGLLKCLEEPHDGTYFFMIAKNKNNILKTILSRCNVVHLNPLNPEQTSQIVQSSGLQFDKTALTDAQIICGQNVSLNMKFIAIDGANLYLQILSDIFSRENISVALIKNIIDSKLNIDDLLLVWFYRFYRNVIALLSGVQFTCITNEDIFLQKCIDLAQFSIQEITDRVKKTITLLADWRTYNLEDKHVIASLLEIARRQA
jgi:hypothetical protein